MSETIRFLLNGKPVDAKDLSPQTTLLEYLRGERGLTGTKEGCAEGDCGACAVVLATLREGGGLAWQAINACIRLLPSVDGKAIYTVESLVSNDGTLHPVQRALVDCHASQCGFCTPGFAMSLFALYKNVDRPSRDAIENAISGNLCRCTGYRPIVDAATRMYEVDSPVDWRAGTASAADVAASSAETAIEDALRNFEREAALSADPHECRWHAPRTLEALVQVCARHPDARIVAGATDAALEVTKQHRDLGRIIFIGDVAELKTIRETPTQIAIGAAVSLTEAFAALDRQWPELAEVWQRFGSVPIRNSATLAGNVANASPIGDASPVLLALGARVLLHGASGRRELPIAEFFTGYRQTARRAGEFIEAILVPKRTDSVIVRAYKISKRYDQDISAVFACFALTLRGRRIDAARIGCGGIAAIPCRARNTEALIVGRPWDAATAARACDALRDEFKPIDDMRASAAYRAKVLGNLVHRFFLETTSGATSTTRVESVAAD
jgi:xanthine dehydrogenase small subunit